MAAVRAAKKTANTEGEPKAAPKKKVSKMAKLMALLESSDEE
jgi:hypothetical protein